MKEDFLHYVWKFQKLEGSDFRTSNNEPLHIKNQGSHNLNAGPDFFNSQIELDGQLWAGNVEIHIKSSDWYAHGHESDIAYDSVILHVVWEHDAEVFRKDGSVIPTFIIKDLVPKNTLERYSRLFSRTKRWINCENDFGGVDAFVIDNWLERLYVERLQNKQVVLLEELTVTKNHWEALLFRMLCKNFGLNNNGDAFLSMARSIDFSVVTKCRQQKTTLEALLLGQAGLLKQEKEDVYLQELKKEYDFITHKFQLTNDSVAQPQFFRLRPPNFPTIRLSQLANLYHKRENLFSHLLACTHIDDFYDVLNTTASDYWDSHFNFGVASKKHPKKVSKGFMDLLIINTILPIKFTYASQNGLDASEEILDIASRLPSEKNGIIDKFNSLKPVATKAYQGQALIQLKKGYCEKNQCLHCAIGNAIFNDGDRVST